MLGSVLCSPGCFSLYRCQAVRDVLPTYATGVSHAFEFLTKDMGRFAWFASMYSQSRKKKVRNAKHRYVKPKYLNADWHQITLFVFL